MRLLLLGLAALLPASSMAAPPAQENARVIRPQPFLSSRSDCPKIATYQTARPGEPLRPRKLSELPQANAFAAVYREIGGCEVPMLVGFAPRGR